jgi:predicted dienelactone hydrolase
MHPRFRLIILAALVGGMAPGAAQAAGPVCDAVWRDTARGRDVPVRIRMPDGSGRAPLILFSHGLGGSLDGGTLWAQAWADAGFIVIHLHPPGSDRSILQSGDGVSAEGCACFGGCEAALAGVRSAVRCGRQ